MHHYTTTFGLAAVAALVFAAGCGQGPGDPVGSDSLPQSQVQSETSIVDGARICRIQVKKVPKKGVVVRGTNLWDPFNPTRAIGELVDPGTVSCPGGELTEDGTDCIGGRYHLRGVTVLTRVNSASSPAVRGWSTIVLNLNGDAEHAGPVWGTWESG